MEPGTIRVGLLGCGNVGAALAQLLLRDGDDIESRTGIRLQLAAVVAAGAKAS